MEAQVIKQLIELNHRFYQQFGEQFSATRQRLQPGVRRILESLPKNAAILDLGCGNGELVRSLWRAGFHGSYLGIDFSPIMIEKARSSAPESPAVRFLLADISESSWIERLGLETDGGKFEFVLAFAVLHHLPGEQLRLRLAREIHHQLRPGGIFMHSVWQFMNSDRLRARIQPWQSIGLNESMVDAGDFLLDWRSGGSGLRYVHHFSPDEFRVLACASGFEISQIFESDGEGGRLGLYQKWVAQ
jgi:SAM-dependent methyltransferase